VVGDTVEGGTKEYCPVNRQERDMTKGEKESLKRGYQSYVTGTGQGKMKTGGT